MNRLIAFVLLILASVSNAANPSFTDFNSNQFGTSGNKVVIKDNAWLTNVLFYGAVRVTNTAVANSFVDIGTNGWLRIVSNNANAFMVGPNGVGMTNLGDLYIGGNSLFTGTLTGNGSGLTNLNLTNVTASGLSLFGVTTNGNTGGSNWVGGINLWNPSTGNTINLTNGNVTASGTFTGNGGGLTNISASSVNGALTNFDTRSWTNSGQTVTADTPQLHVNQTWNNAGVTFHAVNINITNTASANSSAFVQMSVGGVPAFELNRSGQVLINKTSGGNWGTVLTTQNGYSLLKSETDSSGLDGCWPYIRLISSATSTSPSGGADYGVVDCVFGGGDNSGMTSVSNSGFRVTHRNAGVATQALFIGTNLNATFSAAGIFSNGVVSLGSNYFARNLWIGKTTDQIVNNQSAFTNDTELLFAIGASEVWTVDFYFSVTSATGTPDFHFQFTGPSSPTYVEYWANDILNNSLATRKNAFSSDYQITQAGANPSCFGKLVVQNGTNAGTVQLQWAQNSATSEDTALKAGSYLHAVRIK